MNLIINFFNSNNLLKKKNTFLKHFHIFPFSYIQKKYLNSSIDVKSIFNIKFYLLILFLIRKKKMKKMNLSKKKNLKKKI